MLNIGIFTTGKKNQWHCTIYQIRQDYAVVSQVEKNNLKFTDRCVATAFLFLSQTELQNFLAPMLMLSQLSPHFHHSRPNSNTILALHFWMHTFSPQPSPLSSSVYEISSFLIHEM